MRATQRNGVQMWRNSVLTCHYQCHTYTQAKEGVSGYHRDSNLGLVRRRFDFEIGSRMLAQLTVSQTHRQTECLVGGLGTRRLASAISHNLCAVYHHQRLSDWQPGCAVLLFLAVQVNVNNGEQSEAEQPNADITLPSSRANSSSSL